MLAKTQVLHENSSGKLTIKLNDIDEIEPFLERNFCGTRSMYSYKEAWRFHWSSADDSFGLNYPAEDQTIFKALDFKFEKECGKNGGVSANEEITQLVGIFHALYEILSRDHWFALVRKALEHQNLNIKTIFKMI